MSTLPRRPFLLSLVMTLAAAALGTGTVRAGDFQIWHIKAVHPEGKLLDVKAIDKQGKLHAVKAIEADGNVHLLDVKAIVNAERNVGISGSAFVKAEHPFSVTLCCGKGTAPKPMQYA